MVHMEVGYMNLKNNPLAPKPLLKWLMGDVANIGWRSLGCAIRHAWAQYGYQVDYAVCFNNIKRVKIENALVDIQAPKIELVDQQAYRPGSASRFGWKFFPLKLLHGRRELWMDNDLVLYRRHPLIDEFLFGRQERFLFVEDANRWYGPPALDKALPPGRGISAGMLGIPAIELDGLSDSYHAKMKELGIPNELTHFTNPNIDVVGCENASVAILRLAIDGDSLCISHDDIPVGSAIQAGATSAYGMHFTGLNRGAKAELLSAFERICSP